MIHPSDGFSFPFFGQLFRPTPASLCANRTIAPTYVSRVVSVINSLQANVTTNALLQRNKPNFVAYLKNTSNQVLASSNCTAFVAGVKNAMAADGIINRAEMNVALSMEQQLRQAASSALGVSGPNDLYGKQHGGHRRQ